MQNAHTYIDIPCCIHMYSDNLQDNSKLSEAHIYTPKLIYLQILQILPQNEKVVSTKHKTTYMP